MAQKKRLNNHVQQLQVEARNRRERVEQMWLEGVFNRAKIAAALGVCKATVDNDLNYIQANWAKEDIRKSAVLRAKYTRRFEMAAYLALQSYYRSREDAEETVTQLVPKKCKDCEGGVVVRKGRATKCSVCKGTGLVTVELITKRVKGQAGDSSFLRTFKECMAEAAKIKGIYPKERKGPQLPLGIGGNAVVFQGVDYSKLPADLLLRTKQVLLEVEGAAALVARSDDVDASAADEVDKLRAENEPTEAEDTGEE